MHKAVRWAIVAALASVTLVIFSVKPRRQPAAPSGRVVIQYWEKWSGTERDQMQMIVDDFNRTVGAEKGIYVDFLSLSGVDQKTRLAMSAGVPPDVSGVWDQQLVQFAAVDALEPLDGFAREYGMLRERYKPGCYDACVYNGTLWALPNTPAIVALHWNKRIFAENAAALRAAGLDPDRAPRTIDELDRYAGVLEKWDTDGRGRRTRLKSAGYLPMVPGWYLQFTWLWFGGKLYDERTHRFTLLDPGTIKAYEWIQSYSKRLGTDFTVTFQSGLSTFGSVNDPFLTGQVAMVIQGPWMANMIERKKPSMNRYRYDKKMEKSLPVTRRRDNYEWGVAPFPTLDPEARPATVAGLDVLSIPRGSKHKREAFEFIAYVNRQEVMEKLCSMHCKTSPLAKVSQNFIDRHPNPYIQIFEDLSRTAVAYTAPQSPVWMQVSAELKAATEGIYLMKPEGQSVADALRVVQERADQRCRQYDEVDARRHQAAR